MKDIQKLVIEKGSVEAIKYYKNVTGCRLIIAKQFIEDVIENIDFKKAQNERRIRKN